MAEFHVDHPILAIAGVLQRHGRQRYELMKDYLASRIGLEKFDECIDRLRTLGVIALEDGYLYSVRHVPALDCNT